jgi:hypothetical protein
MADSLLAQIEVIDTADGVRYRLPGPPSAGSRRMGWSLAAFGLVSVGVAVAFLAGWLRLFGGPMAVLFVSVPLVVLAVVVGLVGSYCLAGRAEIELTADFLTAVMQVGPIRWSGKRLRKKIHRLKLFCPQTETPTWGWLAAEGDGLQPLMTAFGYRHDLLAALAGDLARRWDPPLEIVQAGRESSRGWRRKVPSAAAPGAACLSIFSYLIFGSFLVLGCLLFCVMAGTLIAGDPQQSIQGTPPGMLLLLLFPLVFIAVGAGGLFYQWRQRGKVERSPEQTALPRRSAATYPTVPEVAAEPGRELRHRLEWAESPAWALGCFLVLLLVCSGILAPSLFGVVSAVRAGVKLGEGAPAIAFFGALCSGGFSLMFLACVVYHLRIWSVGKPVVETSAHPLWPGATCDVLFTFAGPLRLARLDVAILCEESATWDEHSEANSGGETSRVHREVLLHATDLVIFRGWPLRLRHRFTVPPGAMHSFEANSNKVKWLVRVEGRTRGLFGVRFKHDHLFQVLPQEPPA